jgi:hypothetical protein
LGGAGSDVLSVLATVFQEHRILNPLGFDRVHAACGIHADVQLQTDTLPLLLLQTVPDGSHDSVQ